jgi:hypothetical protein
MPDFKVTRYECDHDLLPMVCVRCGAPATECVARPLPKPPKAWTCLFIPIILVVYLAIPASLLILLWLIPTEPDRVRLPVCDAHRDDWSWRSRFRTRWLWPPIIFASLVVQVLCLTGVILHQAFYAHAAAGVLVLGFVIDYWTVGRKEVQVARAGPTEAQLRNVHQAFVDALIHDRARDRVDNPDRRAFRGAIQEDYDDEVT